MSEDLANILRRVQAGELTPDEALPLIDALHEAPAYGTPPLDQPSAPAAAPGEGRSSEPGNRPGGPESPQPNEFIGDDLPTAAIKILANYRDLSIVGDPTVDQVHVVGNHTVRRSGSALVVEATNLPSWTVTTLAEDEAGERASDPHAVRFSFRGVTRSFSWGAGAQDHHLMVRVNPNLLIDLEATASKVRVAAIEGGLIARVTASKLSLERVRGSLDVQATTSSVKGSVGITGASRLAAEASSVEITLGSESSAHVTGYHRAGKVILPNAVLKSGLEGAQIDAVIGTGLNPLVLEASMSSVSLQGPWPPQAATKAGPARGDRNARGAA